MPRTLPLLLLVAVIASSAAAGTAESDSLWNADLRDEAMAMVDADLALAEADGDTASWIGHLVTRGRYLKNMDDPGGAEEGLRRALDLAAATGDSSLACAPRRWLGVALTAQGRNEDALVEYTRLAAQAAAVGDTIHEAWANVGLGWDADLRRDHPAARDFYARAAALFTAAGDGEGALWAELGEANAHFHLGDYEGASAGWARVARIARTEGFARHEAITRNNVAGLQFALGRPDVSLFHYTRAVAVWDSLGQAWERMPPALNRGGCLALLGRVDEAREALTAELATCRESGFTDYEARALRKLAEIERDHGDPAASERLYREALDLGDERPVLERVEILLGIASLMTDRDDHEGALTSLDHAAILMTGDMTSQVRLNLDLARAATLLRLGRDDEAEPLLDRADELMGPARARNGLDVELMRATLLEGRGDTDGALARLEAAAALWETERSLPLDPDWREERGSTGRAVFARLGAALLARDGAEAAFDRLQIAKARTLRERLLGPGVADTDTAFAAPTAADLRTGVLADGEVLLDFYAGASGGLVFALSGDTCIAATIPPADEVAEGLTAWRDLLADPGSSDGARRETATALHDLLLGGVDGVLATAATVTIVPDGPLHLAPLALLADGDATWSRVPSTAVLAELHAAHTAAAGTDRDAVDVLVLTSGAGDLAGADWQGRRLADALPSVTILSCPDPDPLPAEADLAPYGAIHVAAHVRADDVNAWQSAVLLGPGPDHMLRAVEVAAMDLEAELVVLASCGSATGRVLSGEGVQGLAGAFLASGATAVVASLWPVDDDLTALLMDEFYERLKDGAPVAEALADAKADLRADPATAHPFAWAGFVVIGDGETTVPLEARGSSAAVWIAAFAGAFAAIMSARRRRKDRS